MYGVEQALPEGTSHPALVAAIAAFLRPELYIELGANLGATFGLVAPHAKRAVAVDIEPYERLCEGIENGTFVRSDTVEFLKAFNADTVDLVFLDSSHRYEATLAEFAELARVVRPNGVVVFHDSYPPSAGYATEGYCGRVCDAISLLKTRYADWEFATLPAQFGLTIARKNMGRQLLWQDR